VTDFPLDRSKIGELLDMTDGDAAWLRELLDTYVADTRRRLDELHVVLAGGEATEIQRAAHGIKGSSSNIGARRMADLCHEVEDVARAGDVAAARAHGTSLEEEFDRIREDIPRALQR
jgi:HPt (histidine-containing phosphotransfer) domain-containing protein